jgi:hypothetical protein
VNRLAPSRESQSGSQRLYWVLHAPMGCMKKVDCACRKVQLPQAVEPETGTIRLPVGLINTYAALRYLAVPIGS